MEHMEHPFTASEDFSRVLQQVPGSFVMLGARPQGMAEDECAANHSPTTMFDDGVIVDGAALMAELAIRRLARSI